MADRDANWYKIRNIWYSMIHRTTNCDHPEFVRYGARGIVVCDEWHSFDRFYADMKDGYLPGLSIERVDNNQGYSLKNCKWATKKEQANNRRTSKFFTIDGVTKTLAQWVEESGLKGSTVRQRLYGYGWTIERALSQKVGG